MGKYIQFVCSGVSNEHRYFYCRNIQVLFGKFGTFFRKHSGSLGDCSGSLRLILGTKTASNHYKNGFFIFINISIRFLFRE